MVLQKISVKPLKGETFVVEIESEKDVAELKTKIGATKAEFAGGQLKLIHAGKILSDSSKVEEVNIKENEFIVVMVSKAKPPATSTAAATPVPAPTATPASAAATPAASAPAPAAAEGGDTQMNYETAAATLVSGSGMEATIARLTDMGFPRDDVVRCLQAAFNNPDRAVEYLMTGIPANLVPPAGAAAAGGAEGGDTDAGGDAQMNNTPTTGPGNAPFPSMGAGGGGGLAFPAMPAGGAAPTAGGGGNDLSEEDQQRFDQLRNHPRFQELAAAIMANPAGLQQMLMQLAHVDPDAAQLISRHPQHFLQMIHETLANLAGGGGADPIAAMLAGVGGEEGGPAGGVPPGATVVQLTEDERAAVQRLMQLGFEQQDVVQAYLACEKNEEAAANFLFDFGN